MFDSTRANISAFESLQARANPAMGMSSMSVFNASPPQNAPSGKNKTANYAGKVALVAAMTTAALVGKMSMPPTVKLDRANRPKVVTKNAARRSKKQA